MVQNVTSQRERIGAGEARHRTELALETAGAPPTSARLQADLLLEAELRGRPSHGLLRLPRLVQRIHNGVADPAARGRHEWRGDSLLIVDGEGGLGPVVATHALDALQQRATQSGIAAAAISRCNHLGMLAWYCERVAQDGFVLIAFTTSEALVHPWGGRVAMVGTNPIGIGVPADPDPFVLDMATSKVSMGQIHDHALRGLPIPLGWAVDAEGEPTTDAASAKAGAIAPFGEAKGYALGLGFEVLVAALADSAVGRDVTGTLDADREVNKGDVFIVLDPRKASGSVAAISRYIEKIRQTPPVTSGRPVLVPGDRARRSRRDAEAAGIEIDPMLWSSIVSLGRTEAGAAQ